MRDQRGQSIDDIAPVYLHRVTLLTSTDSRLLIKELAIVQTFR
jgi:hypothetical protein